MSKYPADVDEFIRRLDVRETPHVISDEKITVTDGVGEKTLNYTNVIPETINVYTEKSMGGKNLTNYVVINPANAKWRTILRVFTDEDIEDAYVSYETFGDQVEARNVNALQSAMTSTQKELNRHKTEDAHGDMLKKDYDKNGTGKVDRAETADSADLVLWENVNDKPTSSAAAIDGAVADRHNHTNKSILDNVEEPYTTEEKEKLSGIDHNANKYIHPDTHPASMIDQTGDYRFVTDSQISSWDSKSDFSGDYTDLTGAPTNVSDFTNDADYITDEGAQAKADQAESNANDYTDTAISNIPDPNWSSVQNRPSSSVSDIDSAVSDSHTHLNKSTLDKIIEKNPKYEYDISSFITEDDVEGGGIGDMLKSTYDQNDSGKIDVAELAEEIEWSGIKNTPSEFNPSPHTHEISHINNLQSELDGKETLSGAQAKADQAESNANDYTDNAIKSVYGDRFEWRYNSETDSLDLVVIDDD